MIRSLVGNDVDCPPVSLWRHDFQAERKLEDFVASTVQPALNFAWDFVKVQTRAEAFPEAWGLRSELAPGDASPMVTEFPVTTAAEFRRISYVDPRRGPLAEQIEAIRAIRTALGHNIPILATVFSPIVVARQLIRGGHDALIAVIRSDPYPLLEALGHITETLSQYASAAVAAGADGVFLTTTLAAYDGLSTQELNTYEVPYDLDVLRAVGSASFNVMHICGAGVTLDPFIKYPVGAYNWETSLGNPGLTAVHELTGRAVMGGLPGKPWFGDLSPSEIRSQAMSAIEEMGGHWLLVAPGCSVNPEASSELLEALSASVHELAGEVRDD